MTVAPLSTVTLLPNVMDVVLVHEHVVPEGYVALVITPLAGQSGHVLGCPSVKETVSPAEPMFEMSSPPTPPPDKKLEGSVESLIDVLPTSELKLALDGVPSLDVVPPGR